MKIVMWSDVHVEHSTRSDNLRGERQSVLVLDVLEAQIEAMASRPDAILVNGDFFDAFGRIESSLAVTVVERIERLAARGIKIVMITGNHEYPDVKEEYFGRGILTALFSGKENRGIYVIDEVARFIRLDASHVIFGMPYRETFEQFEKSCFTPWRRGISGGDVSAKDRLIVGWHVGLPFGQAWRGSEDENAWITADSSEIQEIFSRADGQRIYLGHYHGGDDVPFTTADGRHVGVATYIGSPATRSRSESGQDKRVGVWEDGQVTFLSTGLNLDAVVPSVEAAIGHMGDLVESFGDGVLEIASIHVDLGDDASMDDYQVARKKAAQYHGDISIIRPRIVKKGLVDAIVEKHRNGSTRQEMEMEIFHFSVRNHFKNSSFKGLSDPAIEALLALGYAPWKALWRSIKQGSPDAATLAAVKHALTLAGVKEEAMPALTEDFCAQFAHFTKTEETARQIGLSV